MLPTAKMAIYTHIVDTFIVGSDIFISLVCLFISPFVFVRYFVLLLLLLLLSLSNVEYYCDQWVRVSLSLLHSCTTCISLKTLSNDQRTPTAATTPPLIRFGKAYIYKRNESITVFQANCPYTRGNDEYVKQGESTKWNLYIQRCNIM